MWLSSYNATRTTKPAQIREIIANIGKDTKDMQETCHGRKEREEILSEHPNLYHLPQACQARRVVLPDLPDAHTAWVEAAQEEEGEGKVIFAIDPGPVESAYVVLDRDLRPIYFDKRANEIILELVTGNKYPANHFAIEAVASYGMAVGKEVFETVFWMGRFWERAWHKHKERIYRKDEKMNLCGSMRAKDSNIRQALIDRFAQHDFKNGKGTKKKPDWFHGFHSDIWASYAVGVTYYDLHLKNL